jgi:EAL domain-containing protein (putative c-di-GMP-specific phosphodiesterase class I)
MTPELAIPDAQTAQDTRRAPEPAEMQRIVRKALETRGGLDDAFELMRQPIFDLSDGRISHYELLLRLRTPGGGLISPGEFASIVKRLGAEERVDNWVAARAVLMLDPTREDDGPQLEINLSAETVLSEGFLDQLSDALEHRGVSPNALIVEVAQGEHVDPKEMGRFARRNFRLATHFQAIDFERTGFNELNRLRALPFDLIKIDGEFIRDLPTNPSDQGIVDRIGRMVSGFGRRAVAMHVEDLKTVRLLQASGIEFGQGYYLGRPKQLK